LLSDGLPRGLVMASPYEIALLCNRTYRSDSEIVPMSHTLSQDLSQWGEEAHVGISDSFFCTKYGKTGSPENIVVFRGTQGGADVRVDAQHLFTRNSDYTHRARHFIKQHGNSHTIVAGHSLGGFIAITMAFHFVIKVAAINPPWMLESIAGWMDRHRATQSSNFQRSKIIVYQDNSDLVTTITHDQRIQDGINFIRLGGIFGFHRLGSIVDNFRTTRRYQIRW